jgi:hypothetical protein
MLSFPLLSPPVMKDVVKMPLINLLINTKVKKGEKIKKTKKVQLHTLRPSRSSHDPNPPYVSTYDAGGGKNANNCSIRK